MKNLVAVLVVTLLSLGGVAAAEPRSWEVGKTKLPSNAAFIVGFNVATIQKSEAYKTLIPMVVQEEEDFRQGVDLIKGACGLDPLTAITDIVLAFSAKQEGVIIVGLNSAIDEAKALDCLQKVATKSGGGAITSKRRGKVTEYAMAGKPMLYVAWLAKDVVALSSKPEKKGMLEKVMRGKPPGGLAKLVAKVNTSAALWAVANKGILVEADVPKGIRPPKLAFIDADYAASKFSFKGLITMMSAGEATRFATAAKAEIAKLKNEGPPEVTKLLSAISLATIGADLSFAATLTDSDVVTLVKAM